MGFKLVYVDAKACLSIPFCAGNEFYSHQISFYTTTILIYIHTAYAILYVILDPILVAL